MRLRAAVPLLLAPAMFAQNPAPDRALQAEVELGQLMAQQFRERNGAVDVPEAQAYLERVVRELAAVQPGDGPCCTVELYAWDLARPKVVAYPGGYLFVPAKLFFTSADENQFVQDLAHAVAHIRQRDWAASKSLPTVRSGSVPLTFMWVESDQIENVPMSFRPEFEAREQRADEAAEQSAKMVRTGTGEFERIRDKAPLPTPRPSLLR